MVLRVILAQFGEGGSEMVALVRLHATGCPHGPAFVEPRAREAWRTRGVRTWTADQEQRLVDTLMEDVARRDRTRAGVFTQLADPAALEIVFDPGRKTERIIPGV